MKRSFVIVASLVALLVVGVASAATLDRIKGTPHDDQIVGTPHGDIISALAGNDTVAALAGNDVVYGGQGHDGIRGGDDNDVIRGGEGNDVIDAGPGDDVVWVGRGADREFGGRGNDVMHALANDNQRDFVDCGPGAHDVVFLNANERDVAVNCETVNKVVPTPEEEAEDDG